MRSRQEELQMEHKPGEDYMEWVMGYVSYYEIGKLFYNRWGTEYCYKGLKG